MIGIENINCKDCAHLGNCSISNVGCAYFENKYRKGKITSIEKLDYVIKSLTDLLEGKEIDEEKLIEVCKDNTFRKDLKERLKNE